VCLGTTISLLKLFLNQLDFIAQTDKLYCTTTIKCTLFYRAIALYLLLACAADDKIRDTESNKTGLSWVAISRQLRV
jgi:hypothetical protein